MHHALHVCVTAVLLMIASGSSAATIRYDTEAGGLEGIPNQYADHLEEVSERQLQKPSFIRPVFASIFAAVEKQGKAFFYVRDQGNGIILLDLRIKNLMEAPDKSINLQAVHVVHPSASLEPSMARGLTRLEAARPIYVPLIVASNTPD